MAEYAILALLLWRAIRRTGGKKPRLPAVTESGAGGWKWTEAGLALSVVFIYGASDEIHQAFVPSRTAQFSDVLVDTLGGAAGLVALWIAGRWRKNW
jgi:VanZ family protein